MRLVFAFVAFMALTGCLPGQEPKQVVVDGTALLEFEPEIFQLDGVIGARGRRQGDCPSRGLRKAESRSGDDAGA